MPEWHVGEHRPLYSKFEVFDFVSQMGHSRQNHVKKSCQNLLRTSIVIMFYDMMTVMRLAVLMMTLMRLAVPRWNATKFSSEKRVMEDDRISQQTKSKKIHNLESSDTITA